MVNYRCFGNATVNFDDKITLFVGVNGVGKTSILDAMAQFIQSCTSDNMPQMVLEKKDFNKNAKSVNIQFTMEVECKIQNEKNEKTKIGFSFTDNEFKNDKFTKTENNLSFAIVSSNIEHEEKLLKNKNVFVYYKLDRSDNKNISNKKGNKKDIIFAPGADLKKALAWFDQLDTDEAREMRDENNWGTKNPVLETVREAICKIFPDGKYTRPRIKKSELHLTNIEDGNDYSIWQLSDGYRAMVALIMDLAYRVVTAQKSNFLEADKSPLQAPGVVLIDELELHLHPSWQQIAATRLQEIFPNIQFICTTHSPQVVTSVRQDQVRVLLGGDQIKPALSSTYGAEAGRVLDEIFRVPQRPRNETTEKLKNYFDLIVAGQGNSQKAKQMRRELEEIIPYDHSLQEADSLIMLENFRREEV